MSEKPSIKKHTGRPIEYPDSPIHAYWREHSRRYYYKKKGKKKVSDELDKFLEYCKKENECNRGQYDLPGGNLTDKAWTAIDHWIRKYRNLQSPLSTPHHTQLNENLVDSQSDSATNSKEEGR